jgi:heme/copper-type cytochrome/quinol oxidase subunit 2
MATITEGTALHPPVAGWDRPMPRDKQLWMLILWVVSFVLIAISLMWFFVGRQNTPWRHYATTPQAFEQQTKDFVARYETQPGSGIVSVPAGGEIFLLNKMWGFDPKEIRVKAGASYTIWYSSKDVVHNPIIADQRLTFTAIPGHAYGIQFTPTTPGEYLIYCAEYCGVGHQVMAAKLVVEK